MREKILAEIKRLAAANHGRPPGALVFVRETGFRESDWRGRFWARWGDALVEAGFQPNPFIAKRESDLLLEKLANACRHYGKMPTRSELKLYAKVDPDFPDPNTLANHFGGKIEVTARLRDWIGANERFSDVAALLPMKIIQDEKTPRTISPEGFVYLIKSGTFHKIGRGDQLERRVKQIRVALPDVAELVHSIRTDDPPGIEAYWHRRFADKRANGEWFKLTAADIAAFRRRKFQ